MFYFTCDRSLTSEQSSQAVVTEHDMNRTELEPGLGLWPRYPTQPGRWTLLISQSINQLKF